KASIASRPPGVYGRLRATRPGEYVLLDTTRLDVYAMEPVTCRWVQRELTAACARWSVTGTGDLAVEVRRAGVMGPGSLLRSAGGQDRVDSALHEPRRDPARGGAVLAG